MTTPRWLLTLLLALTPLRVAQASAPFPPDDTGFVPPTAPIGRCEGDDAKQMARLMERLLRCQDKLTTGEFTDSCTLSTCQSNAAACENNANDAYDGAAAKLTTCGSPSCPDKADVRAETDLIASFLGGIVYCSGTTPRRDGDAGKIPDTDDHAFCERRVAKEVGKLFTKVTTCHRKFAAVAVHGQIPTSASEDLCELKASQAFSKVTDPVQRFCPSCFNRQVLADLVVRIVDANNGRMYCAFPSGAFLDPQL